MDLTNHSELKACRRYRSVVTGETANGGTISVKKGFKRKAGLMKMRWVVAVLLGSVVFNTAVAQAGSGVSSGAERMLFQALNRERQAQGLPSLRWDAALASAARQHAASMATERSVQHTLPGEPSLPGRATRAGAHFSWLSENIVAGSDAAEAHRAFMHSPTHRANILDTDMDSVGIGAVERGGQLYVVEDFSKAR